MLYMPLLICISLIAISYYNGSILGKGSGILAFCCMTVFAIAIYFVTMWLTTGNQLVTLLYMFLSPAAGLIMTIMMKSGREN